MLYDSARQMVPGAGRNIVSGAEPIVFARRCGSMAQHVSWQMSSPIIPLVTVMCWPLLATQFWLEMTGALLHRAGTETDSNVSGGQLPVPDAIQETMDSKLFA